MVKNGLLGNTGLLDFASSFLELTDFHQVQVFCGLDKRDFFPTNEGVADA